MDASTIASVNDFKLKIKQVTNESLYFIDHEHTHKLSDLGKGSLCFVFVPVGAPIGKRIPHANIVYAGASTTHCLAVYVTLAITTTSTLCPIYLSVGDEAVAKELWHQAQMLDPQRRVMLLGRTGSTSPTGGKPANKAANKPRGNLTVIHKDAVNAQFDSTARQFLAVVEKSHEKDTPYLLSNVAATFRAQSIVFKPGMLKRLCGKLEDAGALAKVSGEGPATAVTFDHAKIAAFLATAPATDNGVTPNVVTKHLLHDKFDEVVDGLMGIILDDPREGPRLLSEVATLFDKYHTTFQRGALTLFMLKLQDRELVKVAGERAETTVEFDYQKIANYGENE